MRRHDAHARYHERHATLPYYETFADYKAACKQFCANLDYHSRQLRPLLTGYVEIVRDY